MDSKGPDQIARKRSLIRIFAVRLQKKYGYCKIYLRIEMVLDTCRLCSLINLIDCVAYYFGVIFYFIRGYWANPGYSENWTSLKPALGGVCSLANYSVAYEETRSNRVSDFRGRCVPCFQKQSLSTYFSLRIRPENTFSQGAARISSLKPIITGKKKKKKKKKKEKKKKTEQQQ